MWQEGLGQLEKPGPTGVETATFRLVAQFLSHAKQNRKGGAQGNAANFDPWTELHGETRQ
jgi:hypothetical protein